MSDFIYKGTDGNRKYYEKAPDKDGYVATKTTNMSGSSGHQSSKPVDHSGPGFAGWLWKHRREIFAVLTAVAGFVLTVSKKWLSITNQVIAHVNGKTPLSTKSFYLKLVISFLPILSLLLIVVLKMTAAQ